MPLVFVPSTRPTRILRAVTSLFLCNLFLGGGLGVRARSPEERSALRHRARDRARESGDVLSGPSAVLASGAGGKGSLFGGVSRRYVVRDLGSRGRLPHRGRGGGQHVEEGVGRVRYVGGCCVPRVRTGGPGDGAASEVPTRDEAPVTLRSRLALAHRSWHGGRPSEPR